MAPGHALQVDDGGGFHAPGAQLHQKVGAAGKRPGPLGGQRAGGLLR
jgi:hypothetical protein